MHLKKAISAVQEKGVDLTTGKRSASGTFTADKDQVLVTTIPYDKGWRVKIDGKKLPQKAFKDAFLSVPVSAGTHTIQFSYLPEGLIPRHRVIRSMYWWFRCLRNLDSSLDETVKRRQIKKSFTKKLRVIIKNDSLSIRSDEL